MRGFKSRFFVLGVLLMLFAVESAATERLSVAVSVANIRSGPGTTHDVLWQVQKYYPLQILKKIGTWYDFKDFEGDEGWIHESLVNTVPTVITIKENCNVRSGPGTQYDVVFRVGRGIPFRVTGQKDKWLQIKHADGDSGWIYKTLVW
ncbi:MAG: SH3 domain-containing protein [Deltaproteobacteria bacterium]